jgi:hypothetical protein
MSELANCEIETLRENGELVVSRVRKEGGFFSRLLVLVSLSADQPGPASLAWLQRGYDLRDELDPSWATRPLDLVHHQARPALLLHDPGARLSRELWPIWPPSKPGE